MIILCNKTVHNPFSGRGFGNGNGSGNGNGFRFGEGDEMGTEFGEDNLNDLSLKH